MLRLRGWVVHFDGDAEKYKSARHEEVTTRVDRAQIFLCCVTAAYKDNVNRVNGLKANKNSFEFIQALGTKRLPKMVFLLMEHAVCNVAAWDGVLGKCRSSTNPFHDFMADTDVDRKVALLAANIDAMICPIAKCQQPPASAPAPAAPQARAPGATVFDGKDGQEEREEDTAPKRRSLMLLPAAHVVSSATQLVKAALGEGSDAPETEAEPSLYTASPARGHVAVAFLPLLSTAAAELRPADSASAFFRKMASPAAVATATAGGGSGEGPATAGVGLLPPDTPPTPLVPAPSLPNREPEPDISPTATAAAADGDGEKEAAGDVQAMVPALAAAAATAAAAVAGPPLSPLQKRQSRLESRRSQVEGAAPPLSLSLSATAAAAAALVGADSTLGSVSVVSAGSTATLPRSPSPDEGIGGGVGHALKTRGYSLVAVRAPPGAGGRRRPATAKDLAKRSRLEDKGMAAALIRAVLGPGPGPGPALAPPSPPRAASPLAALAAVATVAGVSGVIGVSGLSVGSGGSRGARPTSAPFRLRTPRDFHLPVALSLEERWHAEKQVRRGGFFHIGRVHHRAIYFTIHRARHVCVAPHETPVSPLLCRRVSTRR